MSDQNKSKNSFILYQKYEKQILSLSNEEAGKLIKAIFLRNQNKPVKELNLNPKTEGYFEIIQEDVENCSKKYQESCDKNRENINKRWDKYRKNKDSTKSTVVYDRIGSNDSYYDHHNHTHTNKDLSLLEEGSKKAFENFWKAYTPVRTTKGDLVPKGSKQKAHESYQRALKENNPSVIIKGLEAYIEQCKSNNFITCAAVTFLNQKRFLDDYEDCSVQAEQPKPEEAKFSFD